MWRVLQRKVGYGIGCIEGPRNLRQIIVQSASNCEVIQVKLHGKVTEITTRGDKGGNIEARKRFRM